MFNHIFESMGTVVSVSYSAETPQYQAAMLTKSVAEIFQQFDNEFSTYKENNFISHLNAASHTFIQMTDDAKKIFALAEQYRKLTDGYFNILNPQGKIDPSGIVKAYAINKAGIYLGESNIKEWCINAGGDILTSCMENGYHAGIISPNNRQELISDIMLGSGSSLTALATSGYSERGRHIWNPLASNQSDLIQVSVVSDDIIYADVMATALMACGTSAISWIENQENAEALLVKSDGSLYITSNYRNLVPA